MTSYSGLAIKRQLRHDPHTLCILMRELTKRVLSIGDDLADCLCQLEQVRG